MAAGSWDLELKFLEHNFLGVASLTFPGTNEHELGRKTLSVGQSTSVDRSAY